MLRIDVITIFPGLFDAFLCESMVGIAIREEKLEIRVHDLRDWAQEDGHDYAAIIALAEKSEVVAVPKDASGLIGVDGDLKREEAILADLKIKMAMPTRSFVFRPRAAFTRGTPGGCYRSFIVSPVTVSSRLWLTRIP